MKKKSTQWYNNVNLTSIVCEYLVIKEILTLSEVCKAIQKTVNTNQIWWILYNKEYSNIRILDKNLLLEYDSNQEDMAKKTFFQIKKSLVSKELKQFKVDNRSKYRTAVIGTIGELDQAPSIEKTYGRKYDLMASFGCVFICNGELSQITAIGVPNLTKLPQYLESLDCILILVNPQNPRATADLQEAYDLVTKEKKKNLIIAVNSSSDCSPIEEALNQMGELEVMKNKILKIKSFTETSMANLSFLIINTGKVHKKLEPAYFFEEKDGETNIKKNEKADLKKNKNKKKKNKKKGGCYIF